ncbi:hypothetical protein [Candidatus Thiothrix anitrata]|uniref:Zinc ribbon domain-containing protein n=1 Tax=Candidatus Thiothrix anitrata TaxID=2823902 RepID=A0ABX7X1P3_9GAMM|nr:hypothetical protein [Candidatus Thiothrix anitrata]QTR49854.1 hypothetical protein J8380_16780 [Candidatus Thiothrix anitrata]
MSEINQSATVCRVCGATEILKRNKFFVVLAALVFFLGVFIAFTIMIISGNGVGTIITLIIFGLISSLISKIKRGTTWVRKIG